MTVFFSRWVEQAMRTAALSHRKQTRKGNDVPYITHPMSVAMFLLKAGFDDEQVIAAALLHDVVEDTDYTMEQLRAEFPPQIADLVAFHTEEKRDTAGNKRPWEDRKRDHLEHVSHAPLKARAIVLADKLHNLATMLYDLEDEAVAKFWTRFNAPPDRVIWYNRSMVAAASQGDPQLQPLTDEANRLIDILEQFA